MLDDVEYGGEDGPAAGRRHTVHGQVASSQVQLDRLGPGGAVGGQVGLGQDTAHLGLKVKSIFHISTIAKNVMEHPYRQFFLSKLYTFISCK